MKTIALPLAALVITGCHTIHDGVRILDPPRPVETSNPPTRESGPPVLAVKTPPQVVDEPVEPTVPPVIKTRAQILAEANDQLLDVFFAYDRSELSVEALSALERDAQLIAPLLADVPGLRLVIEGHCDERGSAEYNLALGDRRASRVADALRSLGLAAAAVETVTYGKERPQCDEPDESCWRRNRRAHLVLAPLPTP
jgi:peptidoglycan-associated lipoprotein